MVNTAYFRNRCFILARKGNRPEDHRQGCAMPIWPFLQKPEMKEFYKSMMIEVDPMDRAAIDAHIASVAAIVKANI